MPYNPLMLNNKKIKLPKEKPTKPRRSLRERFYCWLLILLSSILSGGETFFIPNNENKSLKVGDVIGKKTN